MRSLFLTFMFSITVLASNVLAQKNEKQTSDYFINLFQSTNTATQKEALKNIERYWHESFEIYAVETLYFSKGQKIYWDLLNVLQEKTNKYYGFNFNNWYEYIWSKPATYTKDYYYFKAYLHQTIDTRFFQYFLEREAYSTIRLDEVRWGGVVQDGIPPLRNPKMIAAKSASYLNDDDVVFGISVNGDTRAYPKRILAWHEMFVDTVGDIPVAGVYCTLCGTVILYKTNYKGVQYEMGTSGFLYRSNKLMYDKKTQSLWNTLWGKPVIGPLVNKNIALEYLSVVTTTWSEWKSLHPETKVLSLSTGHYRDYDEGVAYKEYFATDDVMFNVQKKDTRLKNKQEILAIRLPKETDENIAISSKFLKKNPIFKGVINNKKFTVLTDNNGSHRVYFTKDVDMVFYDGNTIVKDTNGNKWIVLENKLIDEEQTQNNLERLHSFNAFWFGYQAAFPEVTLIK